MQKLFNKILVPVNFSRNTSLALDKAIQLANRFNCDVHLLHVQQPVFAIPFFPDGFLQGTSKTPPTVKNLVQLRELEDRCKRKLHDGLLISSSIESGNWQSVLKQTIITAHIDLLVIPGHRKRSGSALIQRVDCNKLSQQTQCPVLTVTRGFNVGHLQNIVVPVDDFLPIRKLNAATYLCREMNGNIHLTGSGSGSRAVNEQRKYLLKAYQLLSDYGHVNIHCSIPDNDDSPASTLSYAKEVKADLIVVNTGKESLLRGWWNKLMGNYLYRESDIPVLTIAPPMDQVHLTLN